MAKKLIGEYKEFVLAKAVAGRIRTAEKMIGRLGQLKINDSHTLF